MVQIIPRNEKPNYLQMLTAQLVQEAPQALEKLYENRQKEKMYKEENETLKNLTGVDFGNVKSTEARKALLDLYTSSKESEMKEKRNADYLRNVFGEESILGTPGDSQNQGLSKGAQNNPINIGLQGKDVPGLIQSATNEQLVKLTASPDPATAKMATSTIQSRMLENKEYNAEREFHTKVSRPVIENANNTLKSAQIKKSLINQQRRNIKSGNTSGMIPFLVDKLGLEPYRNAESSNFKAIAKNRFVEGVQSLGAASARPNQFIEQQLSSAQEALGRPEEANDVTLDVEEYLDDMAAKQAEFEIEEAKKDREQFGYAKDDIDERAQERMKSYSELRSEELAYNIRKRHEDNIDDRSLMKEIVLGEIPPNSPLTRRTAYLLKIKNKGDVQKATEEAIRLGMFIPKDEVFKKDQWIPGAK